ncbi:MAG: FKBP-type peptidyl-prolyl cis-trans isomerase [Cyclobacteriaceae bacterium]|jgi:FKBP-type peptidyl-prolyl cis-trans isomerase
MIRLISFFAVLLVSAGASAQSKKELTDEVSRLKKEIEELKKPKPVNVETEVDRASYSIGVLMGTSLKSQGGDSLNLQVIGAAIEDVLLGKELKVKREECTGIAQTYMTKTMELRNTKRIEEGKAFLAANATKAGVQSTASGLQYQVVKEGTGKKPGPTDRVTVNYTGRLTDGTMFDSSVERGQPATFGVNQVISGWTEALQLMSEGSKWMLYIPSDLGYGARGAGGDIPPHSVLVFEVELLKVN